MKSERVRPVKKLAVRVIDSKAVMLTIADSKLHRLNLTATRIWQGIEARKTSAEIVDELCAEFAVSRERAAVDVAALLDLLRERGIVALPAEEAEGEERS